MESNFSLFLKNVDLPLNECSNCKSLLQVMAKGQESSVKFVVQSVRLITAKDTMSLFA